MVVNIIQLITATAIAVRKCIAEFATAVTHLCGQPLLCHVCGNLLVPA